MVNYRRNRIEGGTYFFTVTLKNRKQRLLTENITLLRKAVRDTKITQPFTINAWVVLPDHMHAIWSLPDGDFDYSGRWRSIKARFSHGLSNKTGAQYRNNRGELTVWQRRFWEHTIRDDADFNKHCDYIHFNPVKHGHVKNVSDWPFSSFHRFVARNIYPPHWGRDVTDNSSENSFGE